MQPRQSGRARIHQANALTASDHSQGKFEKLLLLLLLLKEKLRCVKVEEFGNVLIKSLSGLQENPTPAPPPLPLLPPVMYP